MQEYLQIEPNSPTAEATEPHLTEIWALTATPAELDADEREQLGGRMEGWIEAGHAAVALKTCHRVELYGIGAPPTFAAPRSIAGRQAVSHLLRVAAGLESVIVGEDEVLHQVREALRHARLNNTVDVRLQRLFETAIATGRKARSGRTQASGNLAQNAVAWLATRSRFSEGVVVVAGAGRMGASLAHSLTRAGARVTVASRDPARASRLANLYGGRGVGLLDAARLTRKAVGIAVALGGQWAELAEAGADGIPPVADISAPQAVPESVRRHLNGDFLGIDDLYRRSDSPPAAYIKDAETLVDRRADELMAWLGR